MKSIQAQAAAAIRKVLKAEYPDEKFSVTSDSFAGGTAVRIEIGKRIPTIDGFVVDKSTPEYAMRQRVQELVAPYQYGHFDGMYDIYEYSNRNDNLPQVKYVQVSAAGRL